jgi:hypothetical protein
MFLIQFINTGVIILLVNAQVSEVKLPDFFPIFAGAFPEFNVQWYAVVGYTISFTMILNIFTPHIGLLMKGFLGCFRRCCDRSCSFNKRKTKKVLQQDYEDLYTGPEMLLQLRYSQILADAFIMLLYSSGMPLLYVIGFISFFLSYWLDKFLCKNLPTLTIFSHKCLQDPSSVQYGPCSPSSRYTYLRYTAALFFRMVHVFELEYLQQQAYHSLPISNPRINQLLTFIRSPIEQLCVTLKDHTDTIIHLPSRLSFSIWTMLHSIDDTFYEQESLEDSLLLHGEALGIRKDAPRFF